MLHFKQRIQSTCVQLLAKHINEYMNESSQADMDSRQQEKLTEFLRIASTPASQATVNQELLDLSIDVWHCSGLQDYVLEKLGCKMPEPQGAKSAGGQASFSGTAEVNQGRTEDGEHVPKTSQTHNTAISVRSNTPGSCGGGGGSNAGSSDNKVCEATEVKRQEQLLPSDDPAINFLPAFSRIMTDGYCPTLADILSIRVSTTGIVMQYIIIA